MCVHFSFFLPICVLFESLQVKLMVVKDTRFESLRYLRFHLCLSHLDYDQLPKDETCQVIQSCHLKDQSSYLLFLN